MKVPKARKLKSGTWYIYLRIGGEGIYVSANTEKECTRRAMLEKAEYLNGKKVKRPSADLTLKQAIKNYIDKRHEALSPSTIRGYNTIVNNRFKSYIDCPLRQITDWQGLVDEDARKYAPKTVKNDWRLLCSVLRENGIVPPKVILPQNTADEHEYLDDEQIIPFLEAIKTSKCRIPALLALHSLRRSEIMALTWENVNLKKGIIYVRGASVFDENQKLITKKTNKNEMSRREVPIMIPDLTEALNEVPEEQRTGKIVTCNPNTIWAQVNRVCESLGYPKVGVHGLRHSFASLAFSPEVGMSEREAMDIGGWKDPKTMHKIYEHVSKKNRLKAANKMAQFYKQAEKT